MAILKTGASSIASLLQSCAQMLDGLILVDAFAAVDQIRREADILAETFAEQWDLAKQFGLTPADTRCAIS